MASGHPMTRPAAAPPRACTAAGIVAPRRGATAARAGSPARLALPLAAALLSVLPPIGGAEATASALIGDRLAALRRLAGDGKSPRPEIQGELTGALAELDLAEKEHAAGRVLHAAERLQAAWVSLESLRFAESRMESVEKGGAGAYDEAIGVLSDEMQALRAGLGQSSPPSLPAAIRALRDAARAQAPVYERTGDMWRDNGMHLGGLFYVGNAVALARSAAFYAELSFPPPPPAPRVGELAPELDRLERELIAVYRPPASKELHANFIRASSAIKASRDLLAFGSPEGALYEYLRARMGAWPMTHAGGAAPSIESLRADSDALRRRISAPGADHTIAALFWEKARSRLDRAAAGEGAGEDAGPAAAILLDVLPEYFRLVEVP